MDDLTWWDGVDDQARAWLIAHNGEAVAPFVLDQIVAAGGDPTTDAWWVETVANEE